MSWLELCELPVVQISGSTEKLGEKVSLWFNRSIFFLRLGRKWFLARFRQLMKTLWTYGENQKEMWKKLFWVWKQIKIHSTNNSRRAGQWPPIRGSELNPETSLTPSFKRKAIRSYHICPIFVPMVKILLPMVKSFFSLTSHPHRHVSVPALWDWIFPSSFRGLYFCLKMVMGMAKLIH